MPAKKKKKPPEPDFVLPSPKQIVAHLDQYIIGQAEAKRALASACYCHVYNCSMLESLDEMVWPDNNVLLAGPTGSGKSELVRVICNFMKLPYYQVDCTSLSPTGYKGQNIESVIDNLESHFVQDGLSPTACIVVWDELDKCLDDGTDAAEYRRMLQTDMLRVLEGAAKSGELNSSRILHLACGAFVGLDDIRNPKEAPKIGFGEHSRPTSIANEANNELKAEHFVKFGLIPELVGRFGHFASLPPLGHDDMIDIMTKSKISFLNRKIEQYAFHEINLVFGPDALNELATLAMDHPSGVRGLRQLINKALSPWDYQLADLRSDGVHEIHYGADAVHDGSKAILITGVETARKTVGTYRRSTHSKAKGHDDDEEDEQDDDDYEDIHVF